MESDSDEELLRRFRAAPEDPVSRRLLDELFSRHYSRVAVWCYRFTGQRELAADLAQDIFSKAYRHLDSFRGESRFSTWLYTITRNHCNTELRSRASEAEEIEDEALAQVPDGRSVDALTEIERGEQIQRLHELMNRSLDDIETKVLTLHYAQELSLKAITGLLGLTNASGAKAYVVSAKRKLKVMLDRQSRMEAKMRQEANHGET